MKAIIYEEFGPPDVLKLQDVDIPAVDDDAVLIRVRAAAVNPYDWHFLTGTPYIVRIETGWTRPKNRGLGVDVAGVVESVGRNVTEFRRGDEVFGRADTGAYAEYVCADPEKLTLKPANVSFDEAAASRMVGVTALQALRDSGGLEAGDEVLIVGASGGVGTFAVQIAKAFGARVTGVCSTRNVDMVRELGADEVIDYTREDFARTDRRYDIIFDNPGDRSLWDCARILKPDGVYVLVGGPKGRFFGPVPRLLKALLVSQLTRRKMVAMLAKQTKADLEMLARLMAESRVKPVIERRFPLRDTPEALRRQGAGHARGKTVVTVAA